MPVLITQSTVIAIRNPIAYTFFLAARIFIDGGSSPMATGSRGEVTQLLTWLTDGNRSVRDDLLPLTSRELRGFSANHRRRDRSDHALQTAALPHDGYLRLVHQQLRFVRRIARTRRLSRGYLARRGTVELP